jgi:hypothetical protein
VNYEAEINAKGERLIWLDARVIDRLGALRGPGESYSDVILRLVEIEAQVRVRPSLSSCAYTRTP